MAEVKRAWTATGSLLLAAATGIPVLAQNRPVLNSPAAAAPKRSAPAQSSRLNSRNDATTLPPPAPLPPPRNKPPLIAPVPMPPLPAPAKKPQNIAAERPPSAPAKTPRAIIQEHGAATSRRAPRAATTEKLLVRPEDIPPQHAATSAVEAPAEATASETKVSVSRPGPVARWWHRRVDHCRDAYWGYPEEFEDAPLGVSAGAHATMHIVRGQQVRAVLYHYDFLPSSGQLKPRGMANLARIASCSPGGLPVIFVEPTPCRPDLDEARRLTVWEALQQSPCPIPSDRIVIGFPGGGLRGAEALILDRNRLQQTASRGTAMGGGGGAGGLLGAGGAGLGAGAGMATGAGSSMSADSTGTTGTGY